MEHKKELEASVRDNMTKNNKTCHFLYVPFTGLGLYGGYRGPRWLKNRIQIFKQFVVPSLLAQTDRDFILWVSWRHEERNNKQVLDLLEYLRRGGLRVVFTYSGVCFWDDKYDDVTARERLVFAVHRSVGELHDAMGECDEVLMTIQPSDDCYHKKFVAETKYMLRARKLQVFGYKRGYVMDYKSGRLAEWNPATTPPFYTIKFNRDTFTDPFKHMKYTGPYKSHEYVKDYLKANYSEKRGFIVGTHGENISTIFDHPFTGADVDGSVLSDFGLLGVAPLHIRMSLRKMAMRKLPYGWQRKLRYLLGEKFFSGMYNWLRA